MRLFGAVIRSLEMARSWLVGPTFRGLTYAVVEGRELCLDLYLPFWRQHCPLVIYLHGGGWSDGSYQDRGMSWLTGYGFAVASVEYRLTGEAQFPAQIQDVQRALAWLKEQSHEWGYDGERIAALGLSSGGHLAMLAGLAQGGFCECDEESPEAVAVKAIVNYYGASDFLLRSETQPQATEKPGSVVYKLLGGAVSENREQAEQASPVSHVSAEAPPLLVLHGARDEQVFLDQAHRIVAEYRRKERAVELEILPEGGHGGGAFFTKAKRDRVADFLQRALGDD